MKGNLLSMKSLPGEPAMTAVSIDQYSNHVLVRVDALEAYKFFRTTARERPESLEIDIMEYLSNSLDFNGAAKLISSLEYTTIQGSVHHIAASMTYVQSKGNLWNHLLVLLQEARYPRWTKLQEDGSEWKTCLEITEKVGRLIADFHRVMMKAKRPESIAPKAFDSASLLEWKGCLSSYLELLLSKTDLLQHKFSGSHRSLFMRIRPIADVIQKEVEELDAVGLLIQNHGHLHLGQILVGHHKFTLLDFQSEYGKIHAFESMRQSCLHDYAALFISLQFAWSLSTHGPESMVFRDILDRESEYGAHFFAKAAEEIPRSGNQMSLDILHATYSKAYFRALKDDPLTSELFPSSSSQFESLLKIYMFMRCLKEIITNTEPGNPKAIVALQVLCELESETT